MAIKCQTLHRNICTHLILTTTLRAKYHLHFLDEQNEDKKKKKVKWLDKLHSHYAAESEYPNAQKRLFPHWQYQNSYRGSKYTHSKPKTKANWLGNQLSQPKTLTTHESEKSDDSKAFKINYSVLLALILASWLWFIF